jgi:hypothetical protein
MYNAFINMQKHGGSFAKNLATAWFAADSQNKEKIQKNWPEMVNDYTIWDWASIDNIKVDGIDPKDAPEFCDAYISSCDINGRSATSHELEVINKNHDFVYEAVQDHLY